MNKVKLKDITLNITDGKHGDCKNENNSGYYFLSVKDINDNRLDYSNARQITKKDFLETDKRTRLEEGDTIYANSGHTIGKSVYIKDEPLVRRSTFQKSVAIIKPNIELVNSRYLYYLLKYETPRLRKTAVGSAQKNLLLDDIRNFETSIHNLIYQNRIAKILGDIDDKIDLNKKINEELENMCKTIFDYWFVQFEFPNKEGKPYKTSEGIMQLQKEIPDGWFNGLFSDVVTKLECGNRPNGGIKNIQTGIPSIGAENIIGIGKYNYNEEKFIPIEFYESMKQGSIKSGDILMYKDGAQLGRVSMFKNDFPYVKAAINSHVFILRSDRNLFQNYLYFSLDKPALKEIIKKVGMNSAQPGLNQTNVLNLPLLIPNKEVVEKFNKIVDPMVDMIFNNSKENQELSSLRDFLLPLLMSGQVMFEVEDDIKEKYFDTERVAETFSKYGEC